MKNDLNPQQKEASEAPNVPLLIVAGAGTGKTRTLTNRIAHFIRNGIPPHKICALTFTNKAAKEMASRVAQGAKRLAIGDSPFIGTFHSLGAKILRKESRLLKRGANFMIFDDHDSFDLIKKIARQLFPREKTKEGGTPLKKSEWAAQQSWDAARMGEPRLGRETPGYLARKISEIKNKDGVLAEMRGSALTKDKLAIEAFERYEAALLRNNAFDFDDLIDKTAKLLKEHPGVLKKYREKFAAVLVDEYQDLNPRQYELIKLLAGEHNNLSVVGDDEQMIYGWRYADLKIFLGFEKDWPGARVGFLEENYRSSGNIIQAASAMAKNNQCRFPKNLRTENLPGSLIKLFEANDENDEAEWIAWEVERLGVENDKLDTAILYRTNAQSRAIEQALIRHQIPYKIFGGLKFYERKEVKDVVAALRYAMNNKDELSRERLEKLLSNKKFSDFEREIKRNSASNAAPIKLIEEFLKATDYFGYLERNFINYDERQENIAELINFAARFDDLPKLLEEVALVQATDEIANRTAPASPKLTAEGETRPRRQRGEQGANRLAISDSQFAVNLMTIHLAKGLEFDRVFIAGCSEGFLPHARSLGNEYEVEEERRLMYVAMTRAKKDLAMSFYDTPSRFISELPTELLELAKGGFSNFSDTDYDEEKAVYWD